ncbi:MAG: translation elongation factor Ts [Chloroflexi bacterium RBG_16_48_8]|nr:MAG: translation elongation factor Ts [Chloroflexi bacterium RBG_16_48_8]
MSIGTTQIKELRDETGAGILDCKEALEATGGDFERAVKILREKGFAEAQKRADRETQNGVLELYNHGDGRVGVMVEVNCETDFVARTVEFRDFAHEIALQIAANAPKYVGVEDIPAEVIQTEKEKFRDEALQEGKPEQIVDRIVEGRINKFYEENCLLLQDYVRDDSMKVEELLQQAIAKIGENMAIRRFVRWEMGEEE